MVENNTSYGNIFKSTFLFGFVQVFKVIVGVVKNKIAAIFLGAEGMGMLGIFSSTIQLLQTGAGLGINQSAVRDISEAKGINNYSQFSRIISLTNKIILLTGALGCLLTICLSRCISKWTFGDEQKTIVYCVLSLVVALNIINESKQAILKGMRHLRALAKASIIGSAVGLLLSAPLYYFFSSKGIVPVLLFGSIIEVLVSQYFLNKIDYERVKIKLSEVFIEASPMLRMGIALMFVTFLQTIVAFIINAYVRSKGGFADVGYFSAGTTIINSYFGIVVTALMTDYYPRISAVNRDNVALTKELNSQSIVSLVLCSPMFVLFLALLPLFIRILYTDSFLPTVDFVKWSIYFTLITVISNQVDMILIAKGETKVFLTIAILFRFIQLVLSITLYSSHGLEGLGITYLIMGLFHISVMCAIVYKRYRIRFNNNFIKIASIVLFFAVSSTVIQNYIKGHMYYVMTAILLMTSLLYSYYIMRKYMALDIISFIKNKFMK